MRIDRLVLNISEDIQKDMKTISNIRNSGFPYEPQNGRGTSGFKVSNLWIGKEHFEMVRILNKNSCNLHKKWVDMYNDNHRGLICIYLVTNNINEDYIRLKKLNIDVTDLEYLKSKLFFNLIPVTMPWQNFNLPFFEGVPFQLKFQQMKNENARNYFESQMNPNSQINQIEGISRVNIYGTYTDNDFDMISKIFQNTEVYGDTINVKLSSTQVLSFIKHKKYMVEVKTTCKNPLYVGKEVKIENITLKSYSGSFM